MAIGRPREFDMAQALDRALLVFWRNGYEGASVADLTAAMGINPPSLYAAFRNKEGLFRKALDRYAERHTQFWNAAFALPTARGVVERLLHETADFLTEECNPPGCLFVRGALSCSEAADAIKRDLAARREESEVKLRERLQRAKADGEMPADLDPADYARFVMTMLQGMSVQASVGATRQELRRIADVALHAWPA